MIKGTQERNRARGTLVEGHGRTAKREGRTAEIQEVRGHLRRQGEGKGTSVPTHM